jgi:hypothetical protein
MVTLVVAALGGVVSLTLSRYERVPLVEFSWTRSAALGDVEMARTNPASAPSGSRFFRSTLPNSAEFGYVVRIENISAASVLRCASFHVIQIPDHFSPPQKVSNWVVSSSTASVVRTTNSGDVNDLSIKVFDMQPGADVQIRLNAMHIEELSLLTSACGEGDVKMGAPLGEVPVVKTKSLETAFIKHAVSVFWVGLIVWVILLLAFLANGLWSRTKSDS